MLIKFSHTVCLSSTTTTQGGSMSLSATLVAGPFSCLQPRRRLSGFCRHDGRQTVLCCGSDSPHAGIQWRRPGKRSPPYVLLSHAIKTPPRCTAEPHKEVQALPTQHASSEGNAPSFTRLQRAGLLRLLQAERLHDKPAQLRRQEHDPGGGPLQRRQAVPEPQNREDHGDELAEGGRDRHG